MEAVEPSVQPGAQRDRERHDRRLYDDVPTRGAGATGTGDMGGQGKSDEHERRRTSQHGSELGDTALLVPGMRTRLDGEEPHRSGEGAQECDDEVTQDEQGVVGRTRGSGGRDL